MIVFYGRPEDSPLQAAVDAVAGARLEYVVVDQAGLTRTELTVRIGAGGVHGRLVVDGSRIDLSDVRSVYARPLEVPRTGPAAPRARAVHDVVVEWLDLAPALVVNRPAAMMSNSSKPYQAQLIARGGLDVPATLVTNDPAEVRAFRAHHGTVIYKSISGIRSVVRTLDDEAVARLERIRALPTQFQAYVPGTDVRVHVVGDEVFATLVDSDAVDYRYADRDGVPVTLSPVRLPDDVAAACRRLAGELRLSLCGIDLRRRPDGSFVCFEVNPMPAFSYYESHTGQPIAAALARLLGEPPGASRSRRPVGEDGVTTPGETEGACRPSSRT
jgi:hypothetical protein